jgi:hypothetical protein
MDVPPIRKYWPYTMHCEHMLAIALDGDSVDTM